MLVPNREALTVDCGWSKKRYTRHVQTIAQRTFVRTGEPAD